MKKTILADIITYFFILLFLYTGAAKLTEIHFVKEELLSAPLLGSPLLANITAWALPIVEILLAIALFIPRFSLRALYVTLAMMTAFTIYVTIILAMDSQIACSCGGIIEDLSPRQHVIFNAASIILCSLALTIRRRQEDTSRFRRAVNAAAISLFGIIGWTLFSAFSAPVEVKTGFEGRLLPAFDLLLPDRTTSFNTADIPKGKPFIVIAFSPYCEHCQAETRDIIRHIQQFKGIQIYFVTPYPYSQMRQFYNAFKLAQYQNVVMATDPKNLFLSYFEVRGVPYTAIFDANKRLKVVIPEQANAKRIIHATGL